MADSRHVSILDDGVDAWNEWRKRELVEPDLSGLQFDDGDLLKDADFSFTNLSGARLVAAELGGANFTKADLSGSVMSGSVIGGGTFAWTNLREAKLDAAILCGTYFYDADLESADLTGADLSLSRLIRTNLNRTNLTACEVYGTSVWESTFDGAIQHGLIISPSDQPTITVDNLEVAQFIFLLLNNTKIRHVIDTITSKVVLILGRFTPERKAVLDAIRDELRKRDYLPVLFDFEKPSSRSTVETVKVLAGMARFVIADLTDAKSVLQELQAVVPTNPTVPVQPILLDSQCEPGMFDFFRHYPWMLKTYSYGDQGSLLAALNDKVISPAEAKAKEQTRQR